MNAILTKPNPKSRGNVDDVRQHIVMRQPIMTVIQVQRERLPKSRLARENQRRQATIVSN